MIILLFIVIVFFIFRAYIDHNLIKITSYEVESSKIPSSFEEFKIVQLSDLHNKNFNKQLIRKINLINPNIIVMTGDMVSSNHTNFNTFFELSEELAKTYKVYYIKGNHEGRMEDKYYSKIADTLKSYGITVLDNEKRQIQNNGEYINLYGMWCNQRFYSRINRDKNNVITKDTVNKILGESEHDAYNILLMHTPLFFEAYEAWGADLTLAGHIHGGMIRLPFLGGVFSPYLELFPKYCYGKYDINNSSMIISAGLSAGTTALRLFNRPEIVSITLHSK